MNLDVILEKIRKLVSKKLGAPINSILEDTMLGEDRTDVDDFIIDTIGATFDIRISIDQADEICTVGELAELVKSLKY
jgi:acyl carrier protein